MQEFDLNKCLYGGRQRVNIKRTHMKALDQSNYRCDRDGSRKNASACIADYIKKQIGCNPDIQGSQYSTGRPCTTKDQLLKLKYYTEMFPQFDDKDVYKLMGCLSRCEKDVFRLVTEPIRCDHFNYGEQFLLELSITDRWHEEKEQYLIYDFDSFIADVGGYLGLLLGFSILSLYHQIEGLLKGFIPTAICFGKRNKGKVVLNEVV